jgi:hypothetical protein
MLFCYNCNGQSNSEKLCNVFPSSGPLVSQNGSLTFDTTYNPSGSTWEVDWSETHVYHQLIKYSNSNPDQSFELRIGKGGQIYSFKNDGFGEAMPPQWRPSFDASGSNITDPGLSDPIASNHGNWAPWNDEVWQLVGSDQRDSLNGKVKTRNLHQAGSYMNNYSHRASDHTKAPFYSPKVKEFLNANEGSFTSVYWIQSEDPSYVYNPWDDCDVCVADPFRPSVIVYNKFTNLGDGVIQVDFLLYNYHRTRGIDYWNVPFMGIRNSSLPYAFVSNSTTDPSMYTVLNTKPGHPVAGDEASYLPEFKNGAVVKASGTSSESSGWFAFSTQPDGNGPSLGLVTAKSTTNPTNGYGDFRYGTAMSNPIRDVTILTRRAIGGAKDPVTGLKPWGIIAGQSIQGRYFLVVSSTIDSLVNQINTRDLTTSARIEKIQIDNLIENNVHYNFIDSGNGTFIPIETDAASAYLTLNSQPFDNSYPVFLISTNSISILSSNPYYFSDKPYDEIVEIVELLGFSTSYKEGESLVTGISSTINSIEINIYPNPTTGIVTINSKSTELDYIRIFNYLGQNLTSKTIIERLDNDKVTLDLSELDKGLYIINTTTTSNKVYIE